MAFLPLDYRLLDASKDGDITTVLKLLKQQVSVEVKDDLGNTALSLAAKYNHTYIVKILLEQGALPQNNDNLLNQPMHLAALNDNKEVILLLLDAGADCEVKNHEGFTPKQLTKNNSQVYEALHCAEQGLLIDHYSEVQEVPLIPLYSIPARKEKSETKDKKGKKGGKKGGKKKKKK